MTGRALIVEDSRSILEELRQIVSELVPEVHTADTFAAAQRLSREYSFDLVLLDLGLHDGSGLELLDQFARSRIIVVSSIMDIAVRHRVMELGARDLVSKPFHPGEMRRRIQRVLDQPLAETAPEPPPFQLNGTRLYLPRSGRWVRLRRRDALLLSLLAAEPGETRVFHLDLLREWISSHGAEREARTIRRLRRLERVLAARSGRPGWIVELDRGRFRFQPGGSGE